MNNAPVSMINESVVVESMNVYVNATAERTIEQRAEEIVKGIRKYRLVLKKLWLNLYGAEVYEDYQSIYEETMKKTEKQNADDESLILFPIMSKKNKCLPKTLEIV